MTRLTSIALFAVLLVKSPLLVLWVEDAATSEAVCPRHGRNCTCPEVCANDLKRQDTHSEAACHKPARALECRIKADCSEQTIVLESLPLGIIPDDELGAPVLRASVVFGPCPPTYKQPNLASVERPPTFPFPSIKL